VVEIDTPDIDPSQGLSELPVQPIDTEVVQACTPGSSQQSEFVVTGRGGLPQNPGEALSTDAVQVDLVTLNPEVKRPSTTAVSTSSTSPTPIPIVEAQGWAIAANGEVILTANAPTVTPHSSWQKTANCQQLN
jgi:large exoprotein involved in heme utilization and adhesion